MCYNLLGYCMYSGCSSHLSIFPYIYSQLFKSTHIGYAIFDILHSSCLYYPEYSTVLTGIDHHFENENDAVQLAGAGNKGMGMLRPRGEDIHLAGCTRLKCGAKWFKWRSRRQEGQSAWMEMPKWMKKPKQERKLPNGSAAFDRWSGIGRGADNMAEGGMLRAASSELGMEGRQAGKRQAGSRGRATRTTPCNRANVQFCNKLASMSWAAFVEWKVPWWLSLQDAAGIR